MGGRQGSLEDLGLILMCSQNINFWKNKRVLVTGHTGFKGAWLTMWLKSLGAEVIGISLPPDGSKNLFSLAKINQLCESHFCDIRDTSKLSNLIQLVKPEITFHLAAQSLVKVSYESPVENFMTNIMGTVNVLDSLRRVNSTQVVIVVTTDKVYKNNEWCWPYRENDSLGGFDPYSASKASCELIVSSYRNSFFNAQGVALSTARAGNVIGGGDWARYRLIPDAIRQWQVGDIVCIRSPQSVRPWQHVLDPLAGYLKLAELSWASIGVAGAYNFGPEANQNLTVRNVIEAAQKAYGSGNVSYENAFDDKGQHEAQHLTLDVSKSFKELNFKSKWDFSRAILETMDWYHREFNGEDPKLLCEMQIHKYRSFDE